jgi:hypothetical protein
MNPTFVLLPSIAGVVQAPVSQVRASCLCCGILQDLDPGPPLSYSYSYFCRKSLAHPAVSEFNCSVGDVSLQIDGAVYRYDSLLHFRGAPSSDATSQRLDVP